MGDENIANANGVADVGHARDDRRPQPFLAQLAVDLEEVVFGLLDEDQRGWAEAHDLPANLRPNAPPRPRHQNGLARQKPLLHGLYGGAIEHVMPGRLLNGNLPHASVFQNADVQKYRALISASLRFSGIDGRLVPI